MKGYIAVEELHFIVGHRDSSDRARNRVKYANHGLKEFKTKEEAISYMVGRVSYKYIMTAKHIIYLYKSKNKVETAYNRMSTAGTKGLKGVERIQDIVGKKGTGRKKEKEPKDKERRGVFSGELEELMSDLSDVVEGIEALYEQRRKELSDADKEQVDLYHLIENSGGEMGKEGKLEIYEELESVLLRRREAKNDIDLIKNVKGKEVSSLNDEWVKFREEQMSNRVYHPRIRTDLF